MKAFLDALDTTIDVYFKRKTNWRQMWEILHIVANRIVTCKPMLATIDLSRCKERKEPQLNRRPLSGVALALGGASGMTEEWREVLL